MSTDLTRRDFIKKTAAVSGTVFALSACSTTKVSSYKRIIGANDRISIGIIGCGDRGRNAHMTGVHQYDQTENIEITAVCDPYRVAREEAAAMAREWYGREPRQFVSYLDLLALQEVDAVMIASCDFQHTFHLEAAAKAGKDIYVEKPIAKRMDRLKKAYGAVVASKAIVQVGTQLRSMPTSVGCQELYRTGILGELSRVEQCRNSDQPYWYNYIKDVKKEEVDWDEFLMDLPKRPFDANFFSGWYGYRETSDGAVPGWGSHFIDLVHFITGAKYPQSCVCHGGIFTWRDQYKFTCPDHIQALWVYPEGFMVSYSTNFGNGFGNSYKFFGDQGVLKLDNLRAPVLTAEGGSKNKGAIRGENPVEAIEQPDHFLNWLQCLRNRKTPHAPIEAGYQHAVACLMAVESFNSGKKTIYDHNKRKISTV
jgi:predicted dehydrogenase